jgi:cystathionine gamma-synthase
MPDSEHAVSVSLPTWDDVVGYEEKRPAVMSQLQNGYPRFVIHKYVSQLGKEIAGARPCLPFPSQKIAQACAQFIRQRSGEAARIIPRGNIFGVVTSEKGAIALKEFWQHTGCIITSRQAKGELTDRHYDVNNNAKVTLRAELSKLYHCDPDDIFLFPSGMSATYAALRVLMKRRPNHPTVQIGFPYVDTLKLQQKFGTSTTLLHDLVHATRDLETIIQRNVPAGCFCEIPGNPLLGSADLSQIGPLLRRNQIPLVVDDVVASPINIDVSPYADLIATSLTKYATGSGDVMGGALICIPTSPLHKELKSLIKEDYEDVLWGEDAEVLAQRIPSFSQRMKRHNANGLFIAEKLQSHPAIERVWYPKWEHVEAYESVRRPKGGWGSLITFITKNDEVTSAQVYDQLEVCKGPSLGTDFTLACPFALLAHYTELEWAEACGIPRNLIRISVGLEEPDVLWLRIKRALDAVL